MLPAVGALWLNEGFHRFGDPPRKPLERALAPRLRQGPQQAPDGQHRVRALPAHELKLAHEVGIVSGEIPLAAEMLEAAASPQLAPAYQEIGHVVHVHRRRTI